MHRSQEAYDQPTGLAHSEEVARMHPDTQIQQVTHCDLIGLEGWNAQNRVPTAFSQQSIHKNSAFLRLLNQDAIQFREIPANPLPDLILNRVA